jgi:ketosteroid isomerase-like protein
MVEGPEVLTRLCRAVSDHDLDAVVACFAPEYRNETPVHPERGFVGRDQVRRNWEMIFAMVPDVSAVVLRHAVDGDTVWSEWEHRGTRTDGGPHVMRGVVIFGVADGLISWARFYLEPVHEGADGVGEFIERQLGSSESP